MNHFHIIGNLENRRVHAFVEEAHALGHQTTLTSYLSLINNVESNTPFVLPKGHILRLESPGENEPLHRQLYRLGGEENPPKTSEFGNAKAWFRGYKRLLNIIRADQTFSSPKDVLEMFDKAIMYARLQNVGVNMPKRKMHISCFDDLLQSDAPQRLFIKPQFGSSASGILACSIGNNLVKCVTSLEMQGGRFYNNLKLSTYFGEQAAACIAFILSEGAVVEEWIPKATMEKKNFDFRIVCIAGEPRHIVMRCSRSPMTNLHLGNERGNLRLFKKTFGDKALTRLRDEARKAASAFPDAHYLGVDVGLESTGRKAYVFEVNAFGDLLPGIVYNKASVYRAEIESYPTKGAKEGA